MALDYPQKPAVARTAAANSGAVNSSDATNAQRPVAEASRRAAVQAIGDRRFVTPVRTASRFWPAEAYHQDFARRNPARYRAYSIGCRRAERLRAVWAGR